MFVLEIRGGNSLDFIMFKDTLTIRLSFYHTFAPKNIYLRSFFAILLASLFLLQSAEKFIIVANYQLNKDEITQKFCENKAKPMMHCNGKCHLKKQLQQQDKKENSPSNNIKEKFELQYFSENNSLINYQNSSLELIYHISYNAIPYSKHLSSIFHPPRV